MAKKIAGIAVDADKFRGGASRDSGNEKSSNFFICADDRRETLICIAKCISVMVKYTIIYANSFFCESVGSNIDCVIVLCMFPEISWSFCDVSR